MEHEAPVAEQNTERLTLQEYADQHCNGDRYRAIHELMLHSGEGGFDPYVDELSEEDANFVVCLLTLDSIRLYGSKEAFRKVVKTNQLAAAFNTTADEVAAQKRNPYAKSFLGGLVVLLGAIAVSVLVATLPIRSGSSVATTLASVMIGLASMNLASKIIPYLKYKKLKRMVARLPQIDTEAASKEEPPSFEKAMAFYQEHMQ